MRKALSSMLSCTQTVMLMVFVTGKGTLGRGLTGKNQISLCTWQSSY